MWHAKSAEVGKVLICRLLGFYSSFYFFKYGCVHSSMLHTFLWPGSQCRGGIMSRDISLELGPHSGEQYRESSIDLVTGR